MEEELQSQLTALQHKWLERLRACEASGLSVKAFAEREGLDRKRLYSWRKALTKKGVLAPRKAVQFQRAQMVAFPPGHGGEWHIQLPMAFQSPSLVRFKPPPWRQYWVRRHDCHDAAGQ